MAGQEDSQPVQKKRRTVDPADLHHDDNLKETVELKLQLKMPQDFYDFWCFLCEENADDPQSVLAPFSLMLGGAYDILLKKSSENPDDYWLHDRFYYDLPEFHTVLTGSGDDGFHIGYFWDSPHESPAFLVANTESKGCKLTTLGDNVFAAVHNHVETSSRKKSPQAKAFLAKLNKRMTDRGYCSAKLSPKIKARKKKVVSEGFHTAGVCIPVDEQGVGWREVPRTVKELRSLFSRIVAADQPSRCPASDELQELITYVQFANDEGDYGQGLELGEDLFCYGDDKLHAFIKSLLPMAYSLLKYDIFTKILISHLNNRKRGKKNVTYLH